MKKLLIILTALAALCAVCFGTGDPAQEPAAPETGKRVTVHTPSVPTVKRCLGTIGDAAAELAHGFSVEQVPKEDGTPGDDYVIFIGGADE